MAGGAVAGFGLEAAGQRLYFESDSAGIISILKRRYGAFACGARGAARFGVTAAAGKAYPFTPRVLAEGGRLEIRRGDFMAEAGRGGRGELRAAPSEQCLDAFLRSLLSHGLLRRGGLMLHSAGLVKGGRAYLFPGKSGAGKSTLSKLAQARGAEVISDEINLLLPSGGGWRVFGSPFWGEMRSAGRQASWPLGGIRLLKKAGRDRLVPCGRGELLKALLRCTVNFDRSAAAGALALRNAAGLLAAARPARLEFSRTGGDFLELI